MSADLPPYPEYKDSGVPWLGDVPKHWAVLPNRAIFTEVNDRDHPDEQMLSVTITAGVIPQRALLTDSSKKDSSNQDKSAYKLVRPGDIAYNKMRAWQGALGVSDYHGIVSPAYVVERPREGADPRYLHYLLRTPAFAKEAERWSYGITSDMWSLRPEHFRVIYGCLPPLPEQTAIVRFLDHKDRRIRRYIAAKKKLISLLNEQKQAIIQHGVTRGLDPAVRLKPSGVEWLGDVPEHWDIRRIRTCVESVTAGLWGEDPSGANSADHIVCVRVADFDMDHLVVNHRRLTTRALPLSARESRRLGPGDLLIEKSGGGDAEPVGRVVRFSLLEPAVCSNFVVRLRPLPIVRSDFLLFVLTLLQSTRRNIPSIKQTTGIQNLDLRHYFATSMAVPPLGEQDAILAKVDASMTTVGRAQEQARFEVELIREYRTRLIADVVTGKHDVRDVAAQWPEEVEEPAPLDGADALAGGDQSDDEAAAEAVSVEVAG